MKNIPCAFYDELEAFSLKKQKLTIIYLDTHQTKTMVCGKIEDLYTREKLEYMKLDSGWEIPLHNIVKVGDKKMTDYTSC